MKAMAYHSNTMSSCDEGSWTFPQKQGEEDMLVVWIVLHPSWIDLKVETELLLLIFIQSVVS